MKSLLDSVRQSGVHLWLEDDELRFKSTKVDGRVWLDEIRSRKEDIIAYLRNAETSTESRARKVFGLTGLRKLPSHFPMRVEQMWLVENRSFGEAPKIPFDLTYSRLLGKGVCLDTLEASIGAVVERHDALRTKLGFQNGRPVQLVTSATPFKLDVSRTSVSVETIDDRVREALFKPSIDLKAEVGFRCRAIKSETGETFLGIAMHHYLCDQWSLRIILREIEQHYAAYKQGAEPVLRPVSRQYLDYGMEQRRALSENLPETLSFWRRELDDFPPAGPPHDHKKQSGEMASLYFTVNSQLLEQLRIVSDQNELGLFNLLLGAYQIALGEWCRSQRIVNAISVADRFDAKYAETVGYLIGALAIPTFLDSKLTILELAKSTNERLLNIYKNRQLSYELYDELLHPPTPFCTTLFNFVPLDKTRTGPVEKIEKDDREGYFYSGPSFKRQMHHREFYIQLAEQQSELKVKVFLNLDVFQIETVEKFSSRYIEVLKITAQNPNTRLEDV